MSKYCSGVGKLIHLIKRSRPEIMNCVCKLSRFMSSALGSQGSILEFTVTGKSDLDNANDLATIRSVTGCSTFLNGGLFQ